jgi:hypothetical protein
MELRRKDMDNSIRPLNVSTFQPIGSDLTAKPAAQVKERATPMLSDDSINLSGAESQRESPKMIKINILPQSPAVCPPKTIEFPQDKIGTAVSSDRVTMVDPKNPKAIADLEGNFLFDISTPQFDQVNAFATAVRALDMQQNYRGSNINWAFGSKLTVNPHKQEGKNAYYSRQDRGANFFYFKSPALNKVVQTAQDPDIVVHEIGGHAVLDGIRPNYLGWDSETMGTHEAFSDITSMLHALQDESNLKMIFEQNGGDFWKESLLSRLGEEFGKAKNLDDTNPDNDNKLYLRSMLNDFKYSDPDSLPDTHNPDQLSGESHSFSRVLSGASYDLLEKLYTNNLPGSKDQTEALVKARDTFGKLLMKSVDLAPQSTCKYKDIAMGMLKADRLQNGGKNEDAIKHVFMERNIINKGDIEKLDAHMTSLPSIRLKKNPVSAQDVQKFLQNYGSALGVPDGTTMQLREVTSGKNGETIVNLDFSQEMDLVGKEFGKYEGYCVDINGGMTLAFDGKGNLVDSTFDAIDDDKKADVRKGVIDCIKKGLVTEQGKGDSIFKSDTEMFQGMVVQTPEGKQKIARIPVIS